MNIDAMGCQTAIAAKIIDQEVDCILQVKNLDSIHTVEDCGHGRVEARQCDLITDLKFIEDASKWTSLRLIIRIKSNEYNKKIKMETTNM